MKEIVTISQTCFKSHFLFLALLSRFPIYRAMENDTVAIGRAIYSPIFLHNLSGSQHVHINIDRKFILSRHTYIEMS